MRRKAIATALGLSVCSALGPGTGASATVDNNFGSGGRVTVTDVDNLALVARPGGTLVSVGVLPYNTAKLVVGERTATGDPVTSFGTGGTAELPVPEADGTADDVARVFEPKGMALAADGGVVVQFNTSVGAAIGKITPTGTFDPAFGGGDGWVTDWYVLCGLATDLAIGADGAIYTVSHDLQGNTTKPQCPGSGLRKYTANGTKVTGWGGATHEVEGGRHDGRIEAAALAVGPVGGAERVVTAGVVPGNNSAVAGVLLLDVAGNPVPGFGTDGLATFDPSPGQPVEYWGGHGGFTRTYENKTATDVAIDGAGRIVVVGASRRSMGGDIDVWVARLLPTGQLDPAFGSGGIAWADVEGHRDDYALQVALDGNGRPVITGSSADAPLGGPVDTRAQFTLRLTAQGVVDTATLPTVTTFGAGTAHIPHSMAVFGDARVYTAGSALDPYGLFRGYLGATGLPTVSPSPTPAPLFNGIEPVRALDTRLDGGPLRAGADRSVTVTGIGAVPATGVGAVAVNVTVEAPTGGGYLTVWPSGSPMPLASSLNHGAGQTVANALVVGVGPDGRIDLGLGAGQASVVVDVLGWFATGPGFQPVTPVRALDTRDGGGALLVPAGGAIEIDVTGLGAVPDSGVAAVALNLTAVDPAAGGHLRAWPTGNVTPDASVLNFTAGQTIANAMVLGTGTGGRVTVRNYAAGPVHLVVDVAGWFPTGSPFQPVNPVRALDSRDGAPFGTADRRRLHVAGIGAVPAAGVRAVVVNVTVTEPAAPTYVSVWPAGGAPPNSSAVNAGPGQTLANALVVGVDANGDIDLYNAVGDAHVIVDILGWF
ncbi:MAG: hypothetical protein R2749_01340 [Acidimicrobiales bacterium]